MKRTRVRHHTDARGLEAIRAEESIDVARGWGMIETGIHVEIEPFGAPEPGLGGPIGEMGSHKEGAYVEFDAPEGIIRYTCGLRNTAIIPVPPDQKFSLRGLNAVYIRVRKSWWKFWK